MAAATKEAQSRAVEKLMSTLRELGGEIHGDETIARHASPKIILPYEMEYETAVSVITKKQKDEEQAYEISRTYNYRPYDGARAVAAVLRDHFGWSVGMPVKTLFGTNPPQLIDIDVDVDKREQIPWGRLQLVHFRDGFIDLGTTRHKDYGVIFQVSAMVRRKYRAEIEGVFKLIEEYLKADSIYRGKVITASETPEFIDVSHIDFEDVIYTQQVMEDLETFIWANIDYPQKLRDMGQLGKRVTIVYGTYGVGKTLAAYLTGKRCLIQRTKVNGEYVTCIICRPGIDNWQFAMQIAGLYGRAVIIIEDADLLVDPTDQQNISAMLEQFDGLVTKGRDITLVMTTNHIDKIHKGMLRPGRIDGVIEIGFMDEDGVERLAKRVLGDLLEDDIDWHNVFVAMDGYTPAYVREVLDRSLRRNIVRNRGELTKISEHDLVGAANNLRPQLALMEGAPEAKERPGLDGAFIGMVDSVVENRLNGALITEASQQKWQAVLEISN